jgi:ASC-1-like (ASCH) protein
MKIHPKYLELIKKGIKKHEYRLAEPKRRAINIDDIINLSSTTDETDAAKVKVTKIEIFGNWKEALMLYWQDDFKNMYKDIDSVIKDCEQFYKKEDIVEYGIVVFAIELLE